MAGEQLSSVLRFLRALAAAQAAADETDCQLLHRFAVAGEEPAFRALLQRHGPMVLNVCQRVLRSPQDAEDAFQATFLVFVRKARSIRRPELLGNWLYGVAHRTAMKARVQSAKRRRHERAQAGVAEKTSRLPAEPADLGPLLDEEVNGLPTKYRAPFVLCYLEGRTNEEAARLLGCPKGTVLSRLAWARQRLRSRLTRRGVVVPAGLLAAAISQKEAAAAPPAALVDCTTRAAAIFEAGKGHATTGISAHVIALTEGVLKTMFLARVKMVMALVAAVTFLACGAGVIIGYAQSEKQPDAKSEPVTAETENRIRFQRTALSLEDIQEVLGLDLYKFKVELPKGERFELRFSKLVSKESGERSLSRFFFQKMNDGPMTLRVSFLRRNGQIKGALLSSEKDMDYNVSCQDCSPTGFGTIVPNPLWDAPPMEKMLIVSGSEGTRKQGGRVRLLTLFQTNRRPEDRDVESIYPRVELVIIVPPER